MRRFLIFAAVLFVASGGVWLARVPLAQAVAEHLADAQSPLPLSFDIERLDLDRAIIEHIEIGKEKPVVIDRIEIAYTLDGLRENRIASVSIDGVRVPVSADLTGGIRLAGMHLPATGGGEADTTLPAWTIDSLAVSGIDVTATIDRIIDVGITGQFRTPEPLNLAALPVDDPAAGIGLIDGGITLTINADSSAAGLSDLPLTGVTATGNIDISVADGQVTLKTGNPVAIRADQGDIDIDVALNGAGIVRRVEDLTGRVSAKVSLIRIPVAALPGETAFLTGFAAADIADGRAQLRIGRGASFGVSGLPIGTSNWTEPFRDFGVGFTVAKPLTADLSLTGLPDELLVEGGLVATYGPVYAALHGPARFVSAPDGRRVVLPEIRVDVQKDDLYGRSVLSTSTITGLEIDPDAMTATGTVETDTTIADDTLTLALAVAGGLTLSPDSAGWFPHAGGTIRYKDATIMVETAIDAADTNAVSVTFNSPSASADIALAPLAIDYDGTPVSLPAARLTIDYGDDTGTIGVTAPALLLDGEEMLAGPIRLDAEIERNEGGNLLDGTLTTEPGLSARFHAYHTEKVPVIHTVTASVEVDPIEFEEGGLQPSDVFPFLLLSGPFNGTFSSKTDIIVDLNEPPTGLITLKLENGNFRNPVFAFSNISETLRVPIQTLPASLPDQTVAGNISAGPLNDVPFRMVYTIQPDLAVDVREIEIEGFGGRFGLKDLSISADRTTADGTIFLDAVDFEILTETAAIDGLSADGVLSGEIPFEIREDRLIAPAGKLRALGSGTLTYESPTLNATADSDPQMALLVDALKDFHYTNLSLETDLPEKGDGSVLLNLQGYNPDVLDAQPFNLNVNLESNFNKLANDLYEIYEQATGFVSRATD
ncbi:MAG: YdbH domain-containing protein [Alphaproteobacteria bacterium]